MKRQVAPGPEGMERAYELLQPYYLQVNSYQDTFFVKAIICYYHFKSEHFYHISFKLLPNGLNYWNFRSTRKPGQGWPLSSLQRSRPSKFYQQSENFILLAFDINVTILFGGQYFGSSVHCSVQVPECRKHNVFSVTPSRCRPPLHTGKKFHTNCATQWKVFTPPCPWPDGCYQTISRLFSGHQQSRRS